MSPGQVTSVLVVEDDEPVRLLIRDELAVEGYQIWLAADAAQAIHVLQSGARIDFVLTDVMMPGTMDGLGLAGWIEQWFPGLPVAVTSAKSRDALRRMGMREDHIFFRKPIGFADLRRCIADAVQGGARTRSERATGQSPHPSQAQDEGY